MILTLRSTQKELLDLGPDFYTPEEFSHCQKMLFRVNKIFGFFRSTVNLLKKFPRDSSVLDLGCGAGDFLVELKKIFPEMSMSGIDISKEAIDLAKQNSDDLSFIHHPSTDFNYLETTKADLILSTLMCHHLSDLELVDFLNKAAFSANKAVIINDLHRHPLACWFHRLFSPLLFNNRLISYDGLISIQRSFTRSEWEALLKAAGIRTYQINWCFPFRWQVILWKK